ncbi:MAG: DNA gyrase C-terminal beta-propeller domain-containing protein, partial [Candidatus Anstonellales archaeon]
GIHVEIKLKKGAIPEIVLNNLYSYTKLQISYQIMNVCIVNQVPKVLTLKEMLLEFIRFREKIVTKRTKYLLEQTLKRLNIVNGLIIALQNIDDIIEIIKSSENTDIAKHSLMSKFNLNFEQVEGILNMKLQALTKLEQTNLLKEKEELLSNQKEFEEILTNKEKLKDVIKSEFLEIKNLFADERKTDIDATINIDVIEEDLIENEEVVIILTTNNYIKRIPLMEYRLQNRGGKGIISSSLKNENDIAKQVIVCDSKDYLLIFTNTGRVFWLKAYKVPESSRYSQGKHISNLLKLDENEVPTRFLPISDLNEENYLFMVTKRGLVKKVSSVHFAKPRLTGKIAITLTENDSLADINIVDNTKEVIISSKLGKAIRFKVSEIRETGRTSQGVRGMRLQPNDEIISLSVLDTNKSYLLTITENGFGKRTRVERYRLQCRGGKGITSIITDERNGFVIAAFSVSDLEQLLLLSSNGKAIRMPVKNIRIVKRIAKGVKLMELENNDKIVSASIIDESNSSDSNNDIQTSIN